MIFNKAGRNLAKDFVVFNPVPNSIVCSTINIKGYISLPRTHFLWPKTNYIKKELFEDLLAQSSQFCSMHGCEVWSSFSSFTAKFRNWDNSLDRIYAYLIPEIYTINSARMFIELTESQVTWLFYLKSRDSVFISIYLNLCLSTGID